MVPFRTQLTESLARIILQRQKRSAVKAGVMKEHWWLAISKKSWHFALNLSGYQYDVRYVHTVTAIHCSTYVLITKSFFRRKMNRIMNTVKRKTNEENKDESTIICKLVNIKYSKLSLISKCCNDDEYSINFADRLCLIPCQ